MNVALVRSPWWVRYCPPYILAFFATLLRKKGHSVSVFDLNNILYSRAPRKYKKFWDDRDYYSVWENPSYIEMVMTLTGVEEAVGDILKSGPEVICFTTHTPNTLFSEKLAEKLKRKNKNIITVFMGHKCSPAQMAYDFASRPYIDYVCTGEADIALPELISKQERVEKGFLPDCPGFLLKDKGKIKDCGPPERVNNLDLLPFPDYSDFKTDIAEGSYSQPERLDILDSRGCINGCSFCYERLYWGPYRSMGGKRIFSQVKYYTEKFPGVSYFYFNGLLLNGCLKTLNDFCDRILESKMKIKWAGQASVRADMSEALLNKMGKAGCDWLGYGVESGSDEVLRAMNKRHTSAEAIEVLKKTKKTGISVQANIMFGYPTETDEDFQETLEFIKEARPFLDNVLASQSFCTLEKKTPLSENPAKYGITSPNHHLYWKSQEGKNNYALRFKRYEKFCRYALSLGIPETSGVLLKKPDKWQLLGDYYFYENELFRAAESYEKALKEEEGGGDIHKKLAKIYSLKGEREKAEEHRTKARELGEGLLKVQ